MYKNVLGRNSIDDKGYALTNNVHLNNNYENAFWDGTQMNYGDGDGTDSGPLTSIDVAGHEISHGMTEKTAGLVYSGQSGGLNESMSDIFGKGVEWYAAQNNPAVKFTWGVGEAIWTPGTPGDALRYMDDPTKDGGSIDNASKYKSSLDVHYSSGVANNAFVLMVDGGTNKTSGLKVDKGIGMEDALKIMYRAETVYFTPNETFAQAGAAAVKAATDLFGANSPQAIATQQAWHATGCI
jgi:Zn-dependent metalloprotease